MLGILSGGAGTLQLVLKLIISHHQQDKNKLLINLHISLTIYLPLETSYFATTPTEFQSMVMMFQFLTNITIALCMVISLPPVTIVRYGFTVGQTYKYPTIHICLYLDKAFENLFVSSKVDVLKWNRSEHFPKSYSKQQREVWLSSTSMDD